VSDAVLIALIGLIGTMFSATISAFVLVQARQNAELTRTAIQGGKDTHELVDGKMTELKEALVGSAPTRRIG
jgi:hypothetical protein